MRGQDSPQKYNCNDCRMRFTHSNDLANHSRNFCIRSPYGNIQSLEQKQRIGDTFKPMNVANLTHSNIQKYENYSLEALRNMMQANPNAKLSQQPLRNKEDELSSELIRLQQRQRRVLFSQNHPELQSERGLQTSIVRRLDSRDDERGQFCSPPSYLPQDSAKKTKQSYAKQQSAIRNMTDTQRWRYADEKLSELEDIKLNYLQNNGNDKKFLGNMKNLHDFYQDLKTRGSQVGSRLKTPVQKLNSFQASTVENEKGRASNPPQGQPSINGNNPNVRSRTQQLSASNARMGHQLQIVQNPYLNQSPQTYFPPLYNPNGLNSVQPIIIMPPSYYPPPVHYNPRASQKQDTHQSTMMNRLEQLLLEKDRRDTAVERRQPQREPYLGLVQKFNSGLLPEERVLEALQREEFEELRMLSNLPPQLQKVKLQNVKETTNLRSQIQVQIQQQRILRMRHQLEMQEDQEDQLYKDQIWVDKQRRKGVSDKMIGGQE